eukprot:TRINITY_DN19285_c0_g1_i1.p1 TRINITY_DN19285_c0_g1~~TRINITY_DN19285_c0_g1_i1.p1  ORF type:complete len:108 (-),score=68.56 TRINITY_DN19285_c0_g1_i1:106-429(-)
MIRRPPRSTQSRSSAASDVYKRQLFIPDRLKRVIMVDKPEGVIEANNQEELTWTFAPGKPRLYKETVQLDLLPDVSSVTGAVSYTHLRAHETVLDIVCRLLLEKKKK